MCIFCETVNPLYCDRCPSGPVCFDLPVNHRFRAIALPDGDIVCTGCVDMDEIDRQIAAHRSLLSRLERVLSGSKLGEFRDTNRRIVAKLKAIRDGHPGETGDDAVGRRDTR